MTIQPGEIVPTFEIPLTNGETLSVPQGLSQDGPTLLVTYRGLHCGICKSYLAKFGERIDALTELGVSIIATSSDSREKAETAQREWTNDRVQFGYGLSTEDAKMLRLFLTAKRKDGEPDEFFEPGMYILGADGNVIFVSVQSMPFGRPAVSEMIQRIGWMLENNIPPRGTVRY